MSIFCFSSESFDHVSHGISRGQWAVPCSTNQELTKKGKHKSKSTDKRNITKAKKNMKLGDKVVIICTEPQYHGVVATGEITKIPNVDEMPFQDDLWNGKDWMLKFEFEPDNKLNKNKIQSYKSLGISGQKFNCRPTMYFVPANLSIEDFFEIKNKLI